MISTRKLSCFFLLFYVFFTICFSQSFEELYKRGLKHYERDNYAEAEVFLKEAIKYGEKKDSILFLLGMCSAFQNRLEEAENHFLNALEINNRCEQCYLELGGIYFRKKEHQKAVQFIKRAIKINPDNEYSHDFLGTLYFINGLTNHALREWNRINKPIMANLSIENDRLKRKELIIKELRFSPGQMIRASMIRESRKRLDKIGNISNVSFNLVPHQESPEDFDLLLSFYEEKGFGKNLGFFLINLLGDIPQKTFYLDYKNIFDKNINVSASYRFNSLRKKYHILMTFPRFFDLPFYTSLAYTDKNEVWNLQEALPLQTRIEGRIKTREFTIRFDYVYDDKISYSQFLKFKSRNIPNTILSGKIEEGLFFPEVRNIFSYGGQFKLNLIHNLSKNIFSDFSLAYAVFSLKERDRSRFTKLSLTSENTKVWRRALSDDVVSNLLWRIMLGYSSTGIPLEDKFLLGIGPDAQYYLRAHSTTQGGRLGNSPVVDKFILSNLQYSHHLFRLFPFKIEGGLFIDCANIFGKNSIHYKNRFIVDVGVFSKIYLFKFPFILSYGHNFKEKVNSFYVGSHVRF